MHDHPGHLLRIVVHLWACRAGLQIHWGRFFHEPSLTSVGFCVRMRKL